VPKLFAKTLDCVIECFFVQPLLTPFLTQDMRPIFLDLLAKLPRRALDLFACRIRRVRAWPALQDLKVELNVLVVAFRESSQ